MLQADIMAVSKVEGPFTCQLQSGLHSLVPDPLIEPENIKTAYTACRFAKWPFVAAVANRQHMTK